MASESDLQGTKYGRLRSRVFGSSWLLYAGYYLCRKDVRLLQRLQGTGTSLIEVANLLVAFSLAYTVGHIIAGTLADIKGPRRTALIGGLVSACSTAAMIPFHSHKSILVLQVLNGFGQGFGFPALAKLLSSWFVRKERSVVLAWWSSSYSLGGIVATGLAAWCATTPLLFTADEWKRTYLLPSLLLTILSFSFYKTTKDDPQDAGLPPLSSEEGVSPSMGWKTILQHKEVQAIAAMYFFLKMTRYALLFWLPLYLVQKVHYSDSLAGSTSALFELFGFVGAVLATYMSNRYFEERRYPVAAIMLFALGFMSLLEPLVSTLGWWASAASISFMGILIYGPDALMVSTAVLESVPSSVSGRAIAFVNGVGSVGQVFSPYLVTRFAHHYGWDNLFNLLLVTSLISAGIMARYWNYSNANPGPFHPIEASSEVG
ncbi:MFS transporter [Edaphobacter flagellatus]|uniref:MFS transporter n=1 Tax=Edaphobacter flagellatus TaxID=1933044 RepID=UPI0021B1AFA4|nr:MFS transporter [Edaphobacter flagellatus]